MRRLQIAAGGTILLCWVAALIDGIFTHEYDAMNLTTPVMLVFAGFVFGDSLLRRHSRGGDDG